MLWGVYDLTIKSLETYTTRCSKMNTQRNQFQEPWDYLTLIILNKLKYNFFSNHTITFWKQFCPTVFQN